jgi:hypothetical protein
MNHDSNIESENQTMDEELKTADAVLRLAEGTARLIAAMRAGPGFDDDIKPVRQHASPLSDKDPAIRLAFACMQAVADRADKLDPVCCDADMETSRCLKAAYAVANAYCRGVRVITHEVLAADIVISVVREYLTSRPARKWMKYDERSYWRNTSALLSLSGWPTQHLADKLGLDPSHLCRSLENDFLEIERRFGDLCRGNKALRRKSQLPKIASPICYNGPCQSEASAAPAFAVLDRDFDDLSEIFHQVLFD